MIGTPEVVVPTAGERNMRSLSRDSDATLYVSVKYISVQSVGGCSTLHFMKDL